MGKNKNKKTAKQAMASKRVQSTPIRLPENMSAQEMQHIIARAIVEAEEIKAKALEEQRKTALAQWRDKLGVKEYNNKFKQFFNILKVFLKILFLPKKYIEGTRFSSILLQSAISLFFWIMKIGTLIGGVILIAWVFAQILIPNIPVFPWYQNVLFVLCAILAIVFSRLFRIAGIEIDRLNDRNYLFGLFASITSFVSIIIAVIAIVKEA